MPFSKLEALLSYFDLTQWRVYFFCPQHSVCGDKHCQLHHYPTSQFSSITSVCPFLPYIRYFFPVFSPSFHLQFSPKLLGSLNKISAQTKAGMRAKCWSMIKCGGCPQVEKGKTSMGYLEKESDKMQDVITFLKKRHYQNMLPMYKK